MLALSALTHARIAEAVRWNLDFGTGLYFFEEQAIVVIAVVCALIMAAMVRSAAGLALSVVVGAAAAAVGALALPNVLSMAHCFPSLSIDYAHPPAGGCLTSPDTVALRTVVLGAALVSILFAPAAYAARDDAAPACPAGTPADRSHGARVARGRGSGPRRAHGNGSVGTQRERAGH